MNWGVKFDTNIMALALEELKQMCCQRSQLWGIIAAFLSLLPITAHPCPHWKLTTTHPTKPGNSYGATVGHKAEF